MVPTNYRLRACTIFILEVQARGDANRFGSLGWRIGHHAFNITARCAYLEVRVIQRQPILTSSNLLFRRCAFEILAHPGAGTENNTVLNEYLLNNRANIE